MALMAESLSRKYSNEWLTRCLSDLSESLATNFDSMCLKLLSLETITKNDYETLGTYRTNQLRFSNLFREIGRKSDRAFTELMIAMITSKNHAAVRVLTAGRTIDDLEDLGITQFEHPRNISIHVVKDGDTYRLAYLVRKKGVRAQVPEDFQVQDLHINPICDILKRSTNMSTNREAIIQGLLPNPADQERLAGQPWYFNFDGIIADTIMRWKNREREDATFEMLITFLEARNYTAEADRLREEKDRIYEPDIL